LGELSKQSCRFDEREREKREKNSDKEYEFLSLLFFFSNNTIAVLGFDRNKTGELSLIHHYSSDPALPTEESVRYNI
jgi:hypothetical protein